MKTELIPIIEIGYNNQGIKSPEKYPHWEFPNEWQDYADKSYEKAGFQDKLIPYKKGSGFYRAKDISENNLLKIVNDHFEGVTKGEWNEDETSALFGGYVLKINGEDKLFPQYCGDLSDIVYWEVIANHERQTFYNGHPTPEIKFENGNVTFICEEDNEEYNPKTDKKITVSILEIKEAYNNSIIELKEFELRLKSIQKELLYNPVNDTLENILIYRNREIDIGEVKKLRQTMAIVNTGFWHKIKGLLK